MEMSGEMLKGFAWHANHRDVPGASLFTARLAAALIEILDGTSRLGRRVLSWPGDPHNDAVALRVFAGFHALARTGEIAELSAVYPPAEASDAELSAAIRAAIEEADPFLERYLDSPPQTNETGRSAVMLGACLLLSERFGLPLRLFEIGASAGLNLRLADHGYDLGNGRRWGPSDPPLVIRSVWRGSPPSLETPLVIASAKGCDVAPLDPRNDRDAARLVSYVWPDLFERIDRIEAAIGHARGDDITVEAADAAEWVEREFATPEAGVTKLLFHSMVWSYLPSATQERITRAMEAAGAAASPDAPVAWLRFENDFLPDQPNARVDLRVWPDGADRMLGRAQYHGAWVDWA